MKDSNQYSWTRMKSTSADDNEPASVIDLVHVPCKCNISYSQSSCHCCDLITKDPLRNLDMLNINDLMNLTDPNQQKTLITDENCSSSNIQTIRSLIPQLSLKDQLRTAASKCKSLLISHPTKPNRQNDIRESSCRSVKIDWSNSCPDGDWLSCDSQDGEQWPSNRPVSDYQWKPLADDHPLLKVSSQDDDQSTTKEMHKMHDKIDSECSQNKETSTRKWMKELSRKVKRILVPRLRSRQDVEKLTGAFVDSRLHTLIAEKINEIVQSVDSVESLGAEYISKKIVEDSEVKAELDSLCPIIAKMIFSSKQFRQLQVRIQHPTVRDHLERPEAAKLQKLMMASKRYYQRELNSFLRTPLEDKVIKHSPISIRTKEVILADNSHYASDSEIVRNRVSNEISINYNDTTNFKLPPENVVFKATPLQPKNERGKRVNNVFPLDATAEPFFSSSIISATSTNSSFYDSYRHSTNNGGPLGDREPPDIPTKKILLELDRNVDQRSSNV